MSILTLFVVIPVLMLVGLWLSKNDNQVRGVMVVGATALLGLSIWLTVTFIQMRNAGNTDLMLFTYSVPWFAPLNIAYSVGVCSDDPSVCGHRFHRNFCIMAT